MAVASRSTENALVPRATLRETLAVFTEVLVPVISRGVIIRRPTVVAVAERLDLDRRAVHRMQRLRDTYGTGPLLLRTPSRWPRALVLSPEHVRRILTETPEPFAAAADEKRASLAHFQPRSVLTSQGPERAERRQFNETVLGLGQPYHRLAESFFTAVAEEAECLLAEVQNLGELTWNPFIDAWFRAVRRVVLGRDARDDAQLVDMLARLRSDANWAFLKPRRTRLRQRFYRRLQRYLDRAEAGSLAEVIAAVPGSATAAPADQVAHWLFAFDAGAIATFRTLALLATHPVAAERAQVAMRGSDSSPRHDQAYLRACVLESVRLWPTTPIILRQTTAETHWETGTLPAGTGIAIFAPFFHRDDARLPFADRFTPDLWLDNESADGWPLVPFSAGPAVCPGRDLVLMMAAAMLSAMIDGRTIGLLSPGRLRPDEPLPGTLNHTALRFAINGA